MKVDQQTNWIVLAEGLIAVAILCAIDYSLATWEISFSLFYAIVVGAVSYYGGKFVGSIIALTSVACWNGTELLLGIPYTYWFALYWNVAVRSFMFLLFVHVVATLRVKLQLVEHLAMTDSLTGVANGRLFFDMAGVEMKRASRHKHAFTLIYMDLDGFKEVNDQLGHVAGDDVLKTVAQTIHTNLRAMDRVARLGGDEFAVLLSETDYESASRYLDKMRRQLLETMRENGWNVTFSIGAMTYLKEPGSIDDMIRRTDNLMYSVKQNGKNSIKHEVFCGSESTA